MAHLGGVPYIKFMIQYLGELPDDASLSGNFFYPKNLDFNSGVGIMQLSRLPNQR